MKIAIQITVEVDPEDWMATYGVEREAIREDVKNYLSAMENLGAPDCPMTLVRVR